MDCGSLRAGSMRRIAHRMHSARIDPPIVEIEERAYGDGVVDRLVRIASLMQRLKIARTNVKRILINLLDKAHQRLFRFS